MAAPSNAKSAIERDKFAMLLMEKKEDSITMCHVLLSFYSLIQMRTRWITFAHLPWTITISRNRLAGLHQRCCSVRALHLIH